MTPRISLRDGEKVVINGAVIRASGRTDLAVESKVTILRGREIMSPAEATTPARKLYFHTMMAYLDPDRITEHHPPREARGPGPGGGHRSGPQSRVPHHEGLSRSRSDYRAPPPGGRGPAVRL